MFTNIQNEISLLYCLFSSTLWDKLEEIAPESWDDFSDLFSRQVVVAKPVKPKTESKPVKQQTVKSEEALNFTTGLIFQIIFGLVGCIFQFWTISGLKWLVF